MKADDVTAMFNGYISPYMHFCIDTAVDDLTRCADEEWLAMCHASSFRSSRRAWRLRRGKCKVRVKRKRQGYRKC